MEDSKVKDEKFYLDETKAWKVTMRVLKYVSVIAIILGIYTYYSHSVEDDFILLKEGFLEQKGTQIEDMVPEVLYLLVPDRAIKKTLTTGVKAKGSSYLRLFNDTKTIGKLLDTDPQKLNGISMILKIDTKQMLKDGYEILKGKKGNWVTKKIPSLYISVLK